MFSLYRWKYWENIEAVKGYIKTLIETKKGLFAYIRSGVGKVLSTQGNYNEADKESLKLFTDADELIIAIEGITATDLAEATEDQKEALEIYKNPKERW